MADEEDLLAMAEKAAAAAASASSNVVDTAPLPRDFATGAAGNGDFAKPSSVETKESNSSSENLWENSQLKDDVPNGVQDCNGNGSTVGQSMVSEKNAPLKLSVLKELADGAAICAKCQLKFATVSELVYHQARKCLSGSLTLKLWKVKCDDKEANYCCPVCQFQDPDRVTVLNHLRQKCISVAIQNEDARAAAGFTNLGSSADGEHACSVCGYVVESQHNLLLHMSYNHKITFKKKQQEEVTESEDYSVKVPEIKNNRTLQSVKNLPKTSQKAKTVQRKVVRTDKVIVEKVRKAPILIPVLRNIRGQMHKGEIVKEGVELSSCGGCGNRKCRECFFPICPLCRYKAASRICYWLHLKSTHRVSMAKVDESGSDSEVFGVKKEEEPDIGVDEGDFVEDEEEDDMVDSVEVPRDASSDKVDGIKKSNMMTGPSPERSRVRMKSKTLSKAADGNRDKIGSRKDGRVEFIPALTDVPERNDSSQIVEANSLGEKKEQGTETGERMEEELVNCVKCSKQNCWDCCNNLCTLCWYVAKTVHNFKLSSNCEHKNLFWKSQQGETSSGRLSIQALSKSPAAGEREISAESRPVVHVVAGGTTTSSLSTPEKVSVTAIDTIGCSASKANDVAGRINVQVAEEQEMTAAKKSSKQASDNTNSCTICKKRSCKSCCEGLCSQCWYEGKKLPYRHWPYVKCIHKIRLLDRRRAVTLGQRVEGEARTPCVALPKLGQGLSQFTNLQNDASRQNNFIPEAGPEEEEVESTSAPLEGDFESDSSAGDFSDFESDGSQEADSDDTISFIVNFVARTQKPPLLSELSSSPNSSINSVVDRKNRVAAGDQNEILALEASTEMPSNSTVTDVPATQNVSSLASPNAVSMPGCSSTGQAATLPAAGSLIPITTSSRQESDIIQTSGETRNSNTVISASTSTTSYGCKVCNLESPTRDAYFLHLESKHPVLHQTYARLKKKGDVRAIEPDVLVRKQLSCPILVPTNNPIKTYANKKKRRTQEDKEVRQAKRTRYTCALCDIDFGPAKEEQKAHMRLLHGDPEQIGGEGGEDGVENEEGLEYCCCLCDYQAKGAEELEAHMDECHA